MNDASNPELGSYQCGVCKAGYNRADHLTRHVRGHTQYRPYVCSVCSKGFARQDLLKRHESIHAQNVPQSSNKRPRLSGRAGEPAPRANQACRLCAAKKLKCCDEKPCKRCKQKQVACEFGDDDNGFLEGRDVAPGDNIRRSSLLDARHGDPIKPQGQEKLSMVDLGGRSYDDEPQAAQLGRSEADHFDSLVTSEHSFMEGGLLFNGSLLHDFLECTSELPAYGDSVGLDSDLSLNDMDFSFLDQDNNSGLSQTMTMETFEEVSSKVAAMGSEAYRQSSAMGGWEPRHSENSNMEQQNLTLTSSQSNMKTRLGPGKLLLQDSLSVTARDRILSMILETSSRASTNRVISSFPCSEILVNLIQHYFIRAREHQVNGFIHIPSFKLNSQRPELLGALVATGAVRSPSPVVQKFGFAMQEAVRLAIQQRFEEDNATLRELEMAQAFYLQLDLGLYSAIGRKIEIAESFSMLGVTILRRGKKLRKATYNPIAAVMNLTGEALDRQWLIWAEQESMKRLVYFAMTLDAQVSMARNVNTLFSLSEMGTPLPASKELWLADSASAWKEILIRKGQSSTIIPPSLTDVMRNLSEIEIQKDLIDLQYTELIVLGGIWTLIRHYHQLSNLGPDSRTWSTFVLNSRHTELCTVMQQFRVDSLEWGSHSPDVRVMQEVVSMHLYVSFEDLQVHAGKESEDEADSATSYVQRWFQSSDSRRAVWYGGQVLRAAREFAPNSLTDIYAVAVFQASVVLWMYGLMMRAQGYLSDRPSGPALPFIPLDGEEPPDLLRFLNRNQCVPCITGNNQAVTSLAELVPLTCLLKNVLQDNWRPGPMPVTTEEAFRIVQALGEAVRKACPAIRHV